MIYTKATVSFRMLSVILQSAIFYHIPDSTVYKICFKIWLWFLEVNDGTSS